MNSATIVQKLWNYCNVLRDDGMSYGDYVEQLTYLLFLKIADERSQPPYNQNASQPSMIPKENLRVQARIFRKSAPSLPFQPFSSGNPHQCLFLIVFSRAQKVICYMQIAYKRATSWLAATGEVARAVFIFPACSIYVNNKKT